MPEIKSNIRWPWTGDPRQGPEYFFSMNPFSYPAPTKFYIDQFATAFSPPIDFDFDGIGYGELTPLGVGNGFTIALSVFQDNHLKEVGLVTVPIILDSFADEGKYLNSSIALAAHGHEYPNPEVEDLQTRKTGPQGWHVWFHYANSDNTEWQNSIYFQGRLNPRPFYWEFGDD